MLDVFKVLFILPFLVYAAAVDVKYRRVSNRVWWYLFAGGVLFVGVECLRSPVYLVWTLVSVGVVFVVVYFLFRLGFFGGADAKALILLAFMFPVYPVFSLGGLVFPVFGSVFSFFPLVVFYNAAVLTALVVPVLLVWNLVHVGVWEFFRRPDYFLYGYKTSSVKGHVKVLEECGDSGGVWVSPLLPFCVLLLVGFVLAVLGGDVVSVVVWFVKG